MQYNIAAWLIITLVVLGIIVAFDQELFASEKIKETRKQLTERFLLKIEGQADSAAKIASYSRLPDGRYVYSVVVTPRVKVSGTRSADADVISIFRFKGQNVMARACQNNVCELDKFTVKPSDVTAEPILSAEITSAEPPIFVSDEGYYYNDKYRENTPVFVPSSSPVEKEKSGVLVRVFITKEHDINFLPDLVQDIAFDCRAEFELRCANTRIYTSYLRGCPAEDEAARKCGVGDREETREICGGEATIRVNGKPDCTNREVSMEVGYKNGRMWTPGEEVVVSFWKDTDCTRKTSDVKQLLVACTNYEKDGEIMNDWLGDSENLNAGLLS